MAHIAAQCTCCGNIIPIPYWDEKALGSVTIKTYPED